MKPISMSTAQHASGSKTGISILMLLSGFAGISYEILYGRILGNIIGDQFAVSAAVLITFLLGIGIGSVYAHRLWKYLWAIELGIGLFAVAFSLGSAGLDAFLYQHLPQAFSGLEWAIAVCVVVLAVPAFLIGCSLPLFAGYLDRVVEKNAFSRAYTLYNFGAALTVIAIEFLLLREWGLRATVTAIASLNVVIAMGVMVWAYRISRQSPGISKASVSSVARKDIAALIIVGVASAIFQLFMVKFAELAFGPFRETFALVLSIILLGIAIGSRLVGRFGWGFGTVVVACFVAVLLMFPTVEQVLYLYAGYYNGFQGDYWAGVALKWVALLMIMGLPAIFFGATIPALLSGRDEVARESGYLLYMAALGNVGGFLLMAFVLHQYLDYGVQLLSVLALVLLALLVYARPALYRVVGILLLGGASYMTYAAVWDEDLLFVSYTNFRDVGELNKARAEIRLPEKYKGKQDVFSINWMNGKPYFFINGYISIPLNNPSEKIVGALSSYFSPRTDRALVLGLGSGATASTVAEFFDHTDVVEINPVVRDNLFRMKRWNFDVESNKTVDIAVDDAIHFTKANRNTYSLILNTVTTPLYFSSSKLYTHEFFQVVRDRLTPDGLYVTWLDNRIGDRGVDIILSTLRESFAACSIAYIKSSYLLLMCSQQPPSLLPAPVRAASSKVEDYFWSKGIDPEWLKYQLLSTRAYDLISDQDAVINTLNYPSLEFEMARLGKKGIREFKQRLLAQMNIFDVHRALGGGDAMDVTELLLHARQRLKNSVITRRWQALLDADDAAFKRRYSATRLRYYRNYAANAHTTTSLYQYANALREEGDYPAAIEVYGQVLQQDAAFNDANYFIGLSHERLHEYDQAIRYYRREQAVDPDDADVDYRIGRVLHQQGKYGLAAAYIKDGLKLRRNAKRYLYLGKAYEKAGDATAARRAYRQALELKPKDGLGIRKALARLGEADAS